VNELVQILSAMGRGRLAVMGVIVAGLIAFFIFLATEMTAPRLDLLYADLEPQDSSEIIGRLGALGVPFETSGNGGTIMVPSKQVAQLRMTMAAEGIPSGGSVGYEIFDRSESLGTTSFVQNINHLRALEGELARTIRSIQGVTTARVHLVLPRRELFNRDKREPTASIILNLAGGSVDRNQVIAIQHLVAAAIPELAPGNVSIVDSRGALLARGGEQDEGEVPFASMTDKTAAFEGRLSRQVEDLLSRTLGFGNARAEVTAELDYDRITTSSESYDPDGQVVRSSQTVEEQGLDQEGSSGGEVSVAGNLPQAGAADAGPTNSSTNNRTEETINYEISRVTKTQVREIGTIIRLSVAVLVNGAYQTQDGERVYVPRRQDEMDKLTALVRTAVGFKEERGDKIEVVNMRFPDPGEIPEAEIPAFLGLKKADYFRIAEIGVLAIVALLVVLLVARPLVSRLLAAAPDAASTVATAVGQIAAATMPPGAIAGPDGADVAELEFDEEMTPAQIEARAAAKAAGTEFEAMLDLANIENQAKAQSMRKVGELVQDNPEDAVTIIRGWLHGTG
jgi:flagellar M-ring protein FliF